MGFLSFLSRNSTQDRELKSQAYHLTTPAKPPIKGGPPLAGNHSADVLQRALEKYRSLHSSAEEAEAWLPPPSISRPRAISDARPSTDSVNVNFTFPARPKSAGRNVRYMERNGPPYLLSHPFRNSITHNATQSVSSIPSSTGLSQKPGHVDILDAQGDLRPSNFKARVLAAGHRDFGEDVAERNMGTSHSHSSSTARTPNDDRRSVASTRASSARPRTGGSNQQTRTFHRPSTLADDSDEGCPSPVVATGDESLKKTAVRRRRSQKNERRLGLTNPATASTRASSNSRLAYPALNGGPKSPVKTEAKLSYRLFKTASQDDNSTSSHRLSTPALAANGSKPRPKPRPLSLFPHTSKYVAEAEEDDTALPPAIPRFKQKDSHRRKSYGEKLATTTIAQKRSSSVDAQMKKLASRMSSAGHLREESSEDESSFPPPIARSTGRSGPRHAPTGSIGYNPPATRERGLSIMADICDIPGALPSAPRHSHSRTRSRSIGGASFCKQPQLYDISERIPTRNSSLAPHSSSTTLTTVMSNDNVAFSNFTRPQSQHTAATSVEMYSGKSTTASEPSPGDPPSSAYFSAMEDMSSPWQRQPPQNDWRSYGQPKRQSQPAVQMPSYDCIATDSSDEDSFIESRHRKRLEDESLLFRPNGFGNRGRELPGIPGMPDVYDMDDSDWEGRLTIPTSKDWYVGTRLASPDASKRVRMPFFSPESELETASVVSSAVNDAGFVSDVGEEKTQAIQQMRFSAVDDFSPRHVGNPMEDPKIAERETYDYELPGDRDAAGTSEDRPDPATMMKMRKEMKRQQRLREREREPSRGRATTTAHRGWAERDFAI